MEASGRWHWPTDAGVARKVHAGSDGVPNWVEGDEPADKALNPLLHAPYARLMKLLARRGMPSNGGCGFPKDVMHGYLVSSEGSTYTIVKDLPVDAFSQECNNQTLAELTGEQDGVKHLL